MAGETRVRRGQFMCRVVEEEIFRKQNLLSNQQNVWISILERFAIYQTLVSMGQDSQN